MTTQGTPRTLDELRAVQGDEAQIRAADAYLARVTEFGRHARSIRDAAILRLVASHGPSEAARRAGVSLSTVKALKRGEAR